MRWKGQSSLEFLAMVSLSALLLAALYGVMASKQSQAFTYQNRQTAEKVAEMVSFQVEMALVQGEGYSRVFSVPERIGGEHYTVQLINGSSYLRWGNESVIQTSRYYGKELNISTSDTNVYRVVNHGDEVVINGQ
ncbi:MAG: hypothetical protein ABEI58_01895 [Candidatus Nanohaloarchaea archaeon]